MKALLMFVPFMMNYRMFSIYKKKGENYVFSKAHRYYIIATSIAMYTGTADVNQAVEVNVVFYFDKGCMFIVPRG